MEIRCGGLLFTSKFDSGNLAHVEKTERSDSDSDPPNNSSTLYGCTIVPDYEFNVWTKPDCAGTPYENGNRSWFYFGIKGYAPSRLIKLNIVNLNRQGKLYSQGMSPLVKVVPAKPRWERIRDRPTHQMIDGQFVLSFTYRFLESRGGTTYFAFCFPWSYTDSQTALELLDSKYQDCCNLKPTEADDDAIYYHRELLCNSMDQRRIDLLTITSCENMAWKREPRLDKLFPDLSTPRAHRFNGKKVYFLSSRVHPGETPASFVFNGFLKFILREDDPRAKALRKRYIFKMIPMLNPDGVSKGHYRTDLKGVNLNRVYLNPDFNEHSSIFGSRSLILFYHVYYQTNYHDNDDEITPKCISSISLNERNEITQEKVNSEFPVDYEENLIDGFEKVDLKVEGVTLDSLSSLPKKSSNTVKDSAYIPFNGDYLSISPAESGIAFYIDLHGHASKRGCFIYGNHMEVEEDQVKNLLYPKLISLNSAHFDFNGCNFTERNMYLKDKRDGMSKEGSGRVAMFKIAGLIHSYTLECNYNTGRTVNCIPPAAHDNGRATPPPPAGFPPKYTQESFEEVGCALAVAALDMIKENPWSRILHSEFTTFENLHNWMVRYVRSSRGNPILPRKMARISTRPPQGVTNSISNSNVNNNNNNNLTSRSNTNTTSPPKYSRFSGSDLSKSSGNNLPANNSRHASNTAARNVYNNPQVSHPNQRLAPVKTVSAVVQNISAKKAPSQPSVPTQNDVLKRQKGLIRAAVNGNVNYTSTGHSSRVTALTANQIQELHLHHFPNVNSIPPDVQASLGAALGRRNRTGIPSRPYITSTSQSNPETSGGIHVSAGSNLPATDYNSDSELLRESPAALRLTTGLSGYRGNTPELGSGLPEAYSQAKGEGNHFVGDKLQTSTKATYLGRASSSSRPPMWSSSKPPSSKLPVRSRTKKLISSQSGKHPPLLYHGHSPSQENPQGAAFLNPVTSPSIVGATSISSQVIVGPGGVVSIPLNKLYGNAGFPNSIDSRFPISSSIYTTSHSAMGIEPLTVSQKPLMIPVQREHMSLPPEGFSGSVSQTPESVDLGSKKQDSDRMEQLLNSAKNKARKSAKGKSGKRRPLGRVPQDASKNGAKNHTGKEAPGKKRPKPRSVKRAQKTESSIQANELSGEAIKLSPRLIKTPVDWDVGLLDMLQIKTEGKSSAPCNNILQEELQVLKSEIDDIALELKSPSHAALNVDDLYETKYDFGAENGHELE